MCHCVTDEIKVFCFSLNHTAYTNHRIYFLTRPEWFRSIYIGSNIWNEAGFDSIIYLAAIMGINPALYESAQIDGATRWQRIRYVVIPHLMPLVTFVALIQLMDNFRVFEPIVGFNASAHATSLSWIIFNDLGGETRLLSSAATSSVLTILGVVILLSPVLVRTWRDFKRK